MKPRIKFEYRDIKVVIGQSTYCKVWRASLDGREIPNTFFKSFHEADSHCKAIIDARLEAK
jgi:hypothetical protein